MDMTGKEGLKSPQVKQTDLWIGMELDCIYLIEYSQTSSLQVQFPCAGRSDCPFPLHLRVYLKGSIWTQS